jgi:hypothetical protein
VLAWPFLVAIASGVQPLRFLTVTLAPAACRISMILSLPYRAATRTGVLIPRVLGPAEVLAIS